MDTMINDTVSIGNMISVTFTLNTITDSQMQYSLSRHCIGCLLNVSKIVRCTIIIEFFCHINHGSQHASEIENE